MHRIFGRPKAPEAKPAEPAVSLDGHIQKLEGRVPDLDKKIAQCDAELVQIKAQLGKCRTAAQQQPLKQKAMQILKRKQMYSNQRDSMMQRAFNLEQTQFAIDSMKEAKEHVEVMKSSTTAMKDAAGAFDVGEIEDLHDDMFDMMADVGDVNEILSRPL
jgi:charged multivesicular body protein 5